MSQLCLAHYRAHDDATAVAKHRVGQKRTYDITLNSDLELVVGTPKSDAKVRGLSKSAKQYAKSKQNKVLASIELHGNVIHLWTKGDVQIRSPSQVVDVDDDSSTPEVIELSAPSEGETFHVFLRAHDAFSFKDCEHVLRVVASEGDEEVQVSSSPAVKESVSADGEGAHNKVEISRSFGQTSQQKPRLTPHASIANTDKVEETPATTDGRFKDASPDGSEASKPRPIELELTERTDESDAHGLSLRTRTVSGSTSGTDETEDEDGNKVHSSSKAEDSMNGSAPADETFSTPMNGKVDEDHEEKTDNSTKILKSKRGSQKRAAPDDGEAESIDSKKPPKRSRGTPATDEPTTTDQPSTGEQRGRPQKGRDTPNTNSKSTPADTTEDAEAPSTTKRRGRPRKSDQPLSPPEFPTSKPTPQVSPAPDYDVTSEYLPYKGPTPPSILYSQTSGIPHNPRLQKFLKAHSCTEAKDALKSDFDIFCTGANELKKTGKLLLSVAKGKAIVHDGWIHECLKASHLVDTAPFHPSDAEKKEEWGFDPRSVAGNPRSNLFSGLEICFSATLKKEYGAAGWKEIERVVREAGAAEVHVGPKMMKLLTADTQSQHQRKICVLVSEEKDRDAEELEGLGYTLYSKDLISLSILRGELKLGSSEFMIESQAKEKGKKGRKSK